MYRDPALRPWSQEHHALLSVARQLRRAQNNDALAQAWQRLLDWRHQLLLHLSDEDRRLLPVVQSLSIDLAAQIAREHQQLRDLLQGEADVAVALADLLESHIRFEERQVFPTLQNALSAEQLHALFVS